MRTRTRLLVTTLVTGASIIAAGGVATAQSRTPDSSSGLPTTIDGRGFGHGIGLSQYGARHRAEAGASPNAILGFYYPGTGVGTSSGKIRVLITEDTDNNLTVRAQRGLKVRDLGNGRTYRLRTHRPARAWRLREVNGDTRVMVKTRRWHLFRTGGRAHLAGDGQIFSTTGPLTLRLPSGDRHYRGALRLSETDTVNVVGLEKYLRGVVPAEMPALWHPNALRAQAVAARTYAAFERADNATRYFHVYDTTASQVYGGVDREEPQTNAAIAATARQIRTYAGGPAFTQFSSSNGGYSAAGSKPYLIAQADDFDNTAPWSFPFEPSDVAAIEKRYPTLGTLQGITVTSRDGKGAYFGGRVLTLTLDGSNADVTGVSGDAFRTLLRLRSTYFTLSP